MSHSFKVGKRKDAMSEQVSADVVQKMRRKKRVQILKRIIVICLVTAILLPTILCVILFARISRLERQIEALEVRRAQENTEREVLVQASYAGTEAESRSGALSVTTMAVTDEEEKSGMSEPESDSENVTKVYLTFDDGPSSNTEAILDILEKYQIKATFFVVGKSEEFTPLYQRIVKDGHTLGMHSYSHKYREIYESVDSFREDLKKLQDLIYTRTGVTSRIYRFPGGSSNTVSQVDMRELFAVLDEEEITYYDWNVSSLDASGRKLTVNEIVKNVTDDIQSYHTAIVLMHDANDKTSTVEALPIIIEKLQAMENVEILPITEDTVKVQHMTLEK